MRHCRRLRGVSLKHAARVAATALLAALALAGAASPALAGTTTGASATGQGSSRHVILQAAMGGAAVMLVLTAGLLVIGLVLGQASKPAVRPKPQPVPAAGPDQGAPSSETTSCPSWMPETAELGDDISAPPDFSAGNDGSGDDVLAAPSWLGLAGPLADPDPDPDPPTTPPAPATLTTSARPATPAMPATPAVPLSHEGTDFDANMARRAAQLTAADLASSSDEEPAWPGFLAMASDSEQAPQFAELPDVPRSAETRDHSEPAEPAFPPATFPTAEAILPPVALPPVAVPPTELTTLGAGPLPQRGEDDMPPQRHEVALGDDRIEIVLAGEPATGLLLPPETPGSRSRLTCAGRRCRMTSPTTAWPSPALGPGTMAACS